MVDKFKGFFLVLLVVLLSAVFAKLARNFSIAHVHPNNCRGVISRGGMAVPRVIEVSFIRNDRIAGIASDQPVSLPFTVKAKRVSDR